MLILYWEQQMTKTVDIEVVQASLGKIIDGLGPDDKLEIMRDEKIIATLVVSQTQRKPRVPGLCKDMVGAVVEDDEHLKDFEEYM